ncbi:hypothetical protein AVEN_138842-1 [Araneus ventricosus]|uniref:Uncharacterized protein n=1 Tax=Araneus ventricosus TaxID=182803 RepID=A0A4Y2G9L9_ARAVE|nr:hypothetical protein AVEN_138842-1 [Araneus ventricosus]
MHSSEVNSGKLHTTQYFQRKAKLIQTLTSKHSNKISEINSQEKDNSGELIFVENKETEENQSSSSSLKNKELLKFVVEADTESIFCKSSNKNYETNSKKKNNTEKPSFVENLEDVENQLSSLSVWIVIQQHNKA